MRITQISSQHCSICKMMERILGDEVDYIIVEEHPEAIEGSEYAAFPIYRILDGDKWIDLCAGAMPKRVLFQKAADYANSRAENSSSI